MYYDIVLLRKFYQSELGISTVKKIDKILQKHYPVFADECVIGLGYPTPWLNQLREQVERCVALMPAAQGATIWPDGEKNATALVSETELPLADASVDYVLMVHALEHSENEQETLKEIWRVLAPSGRLILIVPHRLSFWINREETPFGNGRPYSPNQLKKCLNTAHFSCHNLQEALYTIPDQRWIPEFIIQKLRKIIPLVGGVLIIEAHKKMYQGVPSTLSKSKRRRRLKPIFIPQSANRE